MLARKHLYPLLLVLSGLFIFPSFAQQSATYADEYALYQQAQAETDGAKQKALVLDFVRKYSQSELDPHVAYVYQQYLQGLKGQGAWAQLAADAEQFLQHRPTDKVVAAMAMEGYQKLGKPAELVRFGSQLYQKSPGAAPAYLVASAYKSMGDTANFMVWADRTLRHAPGNLEMLLELINLHWQQGTLDQATGYAEKVIASPEAGDQQKAFACRALGQAAFLQGDNGAARKHFAESVKLDPKSDFAQLQLGYTCWRAGRLDEAINAFSKAVALGGSSSREARRELMNLLKSRYGSASDMTKFIDAAKKELGIS